jgi:predicted DNA-binding antitoxin AbrB/MazE fold protein
MVNEVEAVFEHGAFVPVTPCDVPEGTRVTLTVHAKPNVRPPEVTDPERRKKIMRKLIENIATQPGSGRGSRTFHSGRVVQSR